MSSSVYVYQYFKAKSYCEERENQSDIQVSLCYILKHLEDRKVGSVPVYYTWCDIISFSN